MTIERIPGSHCAGSKQNPTHLAPSTEYFVGVQGGSLEARVRSPGGHIDGLERADSTGQLGHAAGSEPPALR
jgi:hypothetical protein